MSISHINSVGSPSFYGIIPLTRRSMAAQFSLAVRGSLKSLHCTVFSVSREFVLYIQDHVCGANFMRLGVERSIV